MAGTRVLLRGHYNPTKWSRKYPNLQKAKLANGKTDLVCTKCIKKLPQTYVPAAPMEKPVITPVAE